MRALEAHAALWIAGGTAQPQRHAVQLALGLLVAAAVGGAALAGLGMDAVREGLAAVSRAGCARSSWPFCI